jgi:hypothetical protein
LGGDPDRRSARRTIESSSHLCGSDEPL